MTTIPWSRSWRTIIGAAAALCLLAACGRSAAAPTPTLVAPTATAPVPTATVAAVTPTEAAAPTVIPSAQPTAPALPADPGPAPLTADLPDALAAYATEVGGDAEALLVALDAWRMPPPADPGAPVAEASTAPQQVDLNGDGQPEIALIVQDSATTGAVSPTQTLIVLSPRDGQYRPAYSATSADYGGGHMALLPPVDFTGDGVEDLTVLTTGCGAHTCTTSAILVSAQGGTYRDWAGNVALYTVDSVVWQDMDDGTSALVMHGGYIASIGAGPQRTMTLTYRLIDDAFRLASVEYAPSDLLYFRILDGNEALAQGFTNEAIAIYTEALNNPDLVDSGIMASSDDERFALESFAHFRLLVAYAINGEPHTGRELAQLRTDAGPFLPAGEAFWGTYSASQSIEAGCAAVAEAALAHPEMLELLNMYGYANPFFEADDLCRGTGTGLPEPYARPLQVPACGGCG